MGVTDGAIVLSKSEMTVEIEGLVPNAGTGSPSGSLTTVVAGSPTASATLTAATTGNGTTVDWGYAKTNVSLAIIVNGTVTGGVVDLQVSQNGTDWIKISSSATLGTGVNQQLTLSSAAFRYARGVVSTNVTGGGTVTCTLMST